MRREQQQMIISTLFRSFPASAILWFSDSQCRWSETSGRLSLIVSNYVFEERGKDIWYAFLAKLKWKWKPLKLSTIWELFVKADYLLQDVTEDFVITIVHRILPENSSSLCDISNYRQRMFGCRWKSSLRHIHSRQLPGAIKQPRLCRLLLSNQYAGVSAWQLLFLPLRQEL